MNSLSLGYHYHIPADLQNGSLYTAGYQGRFLESLAALCKKVTCFLHTPRLYERELMDHKITMPNIEWINLGRRPSVPVRLFKARQYLQRFKAMSTDVDIFLVRSPTPLLAAFAGAAKCPLSLLIVGDYVKGTEGLAQPKWRKELIRLWAKWNRFEQVKIARKALTFINNPLIYQDYQDSARKSVLIKTATLREEEFYERPDTCLNNPCRILYAGRMDQDKGILEMIEAAADLVREGRNVVLDLVGSLNSQDAFSKAVSQNIKTHRLENKVFCRGHKSLGPELFSFYKQADIFIVASRTSEGFPRSIWEAMAHSLPVIATNIGSMSMMLGDSAVLIPPGKPPAIAEAVKKIMDDAVLRRTLILKGRQLAKEATLKVQAEKMVKEMELWLQCQPSRN